VGVLELNLKPPPPTNDWIFLSGKVDMVSRTPFAELQDGNRDDKKENYHALFA
jgi:hypothetical protein